jgi:uncharacterized protein (TIGR02147 family)
MATDLFSFDDFREFIRSEVKRNRDSRGYQTRLATAAGCQRSYLSQVIHSHVLITPDQALGMAGFWGLDEYQTEYFLDLVNLARASTTALRNRLQSRLDLAREKNTDLSRRLAPRALKPKAEIESRYYSSWYWSAIHIATCLGSLRTSGDIARRFGLAVPLVEQVLKDLESAGLVAREQGKWKIAIRHLHLGKESPFMVAHHTHWRQKAIGKIQKGDFSDLHYASILALGQRDFREVQEVLLQTISKVRHQVETAPDEEVAVFTCDFFRLREGKD